MSEDLTAKICAPCRGGIPPLPREGAEKLLTQAAGWTLEAMPTIFFVVLNLAISRTRWRS